MERPEPLRAVQAVFRHVEAGLVALFFIQAIRFLYSTLYAHLGSLDQWTKTLDRTSLSGVPGIITPGDVRIELLAVGLFALLPILALLISRWRFATLVAVLAAVGRVYLTESGPSVIGVIGAALAAGSAGLYLAVLTRRRPLVFPAALVLGIAADQLLRLAGASVDLTWSSGWLLVPVGLALLLFVLVLVNLVIDVAEIRQITQARRAANADINAPSTLPQLPAPTTISAWGALAFGGLLYLELTLLGLANTAGRRAGVEPSVIAPWLAAVTLLPLVPAVREGLRRFLGMFDGQWRGWVYTLVLGLLLVIGFRFSGPIAAIGLIAAQLFIGLGWWWVAQPVDKRAWFSGIGLVIGLIVFLVLTGAEYFTYDYAFVYSAPEPIGSAIRSLRGLGLVVVLVAGLLVTLPAIVARRRLSWQGGRGRDSAFMVALCVLSGLLAFTLTPPLVVTPSANPQHLRLATLNLHGGYSLYFNSDLPQLATQISTSGADILLLQEVETGRLVSNSVDQVDWLAHALHMQAIYFPTNESAQGLAILTRLPVIDQHGTLLTSVGKQTGVLYARLMAADGQPIDVYDTELGFLLKDVSQSTADQEQDQRTQLGQVFGLVNQTDPGLTLRTMLGGTFNNVPTSDLYQIVSQSFADPFAGQAVEKTITWRLVNQIVSRVDYLWLHGITSLGAGIIPVSASTHDLAVVEISLSAAGN
jgi:endonuclease/exonuclease/phosphatase family metal-dependent hydrolase